MKTLETLSTRKAIKSWGDRWVELITKDLEQTGPVLQEQLYVEVDKISLLNAIFIKSFTAKKLQPLFITWCANKEQELLSAAENDLRSQFEHKIILHGIKDGMEIDVSKESMLDLASVALSGAVAAATIPAIVASSTAIVSVGGFLGLIGMTTTVWATKNIVAGLVVLSIILLIMIYRSTKITCNAKVRLRKKIQQQMQDRLVYSKKKTSLKMLLINRIEDTAKQLLKEFAHA